MNVALADTSVLVKWFAEQNENEIDAARRLRQAHIDGAVSILLLDLGAYEMSNVLIRRLRWPAVAAVEALEQLLTLVGPLVRLDSGWLADALTLAERYGLSGYDAHWAAAARHLRVPLITADQQLLGTGLAESPRAAAARFGLLP